MKIFYSILPFLTAAVLGLSAMPSGSLRAQSMESIDSVLAAVERNNLQLRALQPPAGPLRILQPLLYPWL